MTTAQIKKLRERLSRLYNSIEGSSTMDIVHEIVAIELELELEKESNK